MSETMAPVMNLNAAIYGQQPADGVMREVLPGVFVRASAYSAAERVASARAAYIQARADLSAANRGMIRDDGKSRLVPLMRRGFTDAENRRSAKMHAMRMLNRALRQCRAAEFALALDALPARRLMAAE